MKKAKQDSLLGVVFFVSLGLLLWATFALTDLSFQARPTYDVFCPNAGNIRSGDPVYVLGNRAGQVARVDYLRDATAPSMRIRLRLELREAVTLRRDAVIEITAPNLLGGKVIEIDPGIADDIWPESEALTARLKTSGLDALGDLLDDPELQDDFRQIISGVRAAVDKLNSTEGTIGLLINSDQLYQDFLGATQSARKSLEELEKAQSPLGRLIYSEEDGEKLSSAIARVESIATTIDEGDGMLGRIVNDPELGANTDRLIADAADIVTDAKNGVGTIGRLLRSEEMGEKFDRIVDGFADFATKINDPTAGLVGALVSDPELADKGRKFLSDLEVIGDQLTNGNGALARLINDEDLGERLNRIINQVSRAIEDAREAAPIGTFFQVITGSF